MKEWQSATLVFKFLRWLCIWAAVLMGARIHEATYVEQVYGRGDPPPGLTMLIVNVAIVFAALNVTILLVAQCLVSAKVFPQYVFTATLIDSGIYTGVLVGMAFLLKMFLETKRYLNYKKDGIRAIRAYRDILLWIVFPLAVAPIFFQGI